MVVVLFEHSELLTAHSQCLFHQIENAARSWFFFSSLILATGRCLFPFNLMKAHTQHNMVTGIVYKKSHSHGMHILEHI